MSFYDYLQNTAKEIDKELESFFQEWSKDVQHKSSRLFPLANALGDACRGGKRIRGMLVRLGYEMGVGNEKGEMRIEKRRLREILKIAAAYEIFQAAILAHDDIIDRSPFRRGKASLYARLGGDHAGISKAICLGDIGFFLAFQLIAESGFGEKEKNRALAIFSKTMLETGIGELLDVELSNVKAGKEIPKQVRDDIITVYKFKTAYYTITAPLLLGGVLGGLADSCLSAIKMFGQNLGIAFQIQDDINDIFLDKKQLGKELGGDIKEGKQTLLYIYARDNSDKRQRELLEEYYGNSGIGLVEIETVKKVFVETGALDHAREEVRRYSKVAKEFVPKITRSEGFGKMLLEMTEYFVRD